jgi:hypothetical protein
MEMRRKYSKISNITKSEIVLYHLCIAINYHRRHHLLRIFNNIPHSRRLVIGNTIITMTSSNLLQILQELRLLPVAENEATATATAAVERLSEWNDKMEAILFGPSSSLPSAPPDDDDDSANAVSQHLVRLLLTRLFLHSSKQKDLEEANAIYNDSDYTTEELAAAVVAKFRGTDAACNHAAVLTDDSAGIKEILRTSKNWLRWYLQIYIVTATATTSSTTTNNTATALQQWESHDMLELYLLLLELSVPEAPTVARLISQLFFYASYDQSTVQGANDTLQHAYAYLVQDLTFFPRVLTLMVLVRNSINNNGYNTNISNSSATALVALALSLVRNVHNILATYPSAKAAVEATMVEVKVDPVLDEDDSARNPWTYRTALLALMETVPSTTATSATITTITTEQQEHQAQLTLEILRTFYALCVGRDLAVPVPDDRLARCLLDLLRVDQNNVPVAAATTATDNAQASNVEIPLATVSVLMDANPTFAEYMVQQDAVQPVLDLLERQVTYILENVLFDQRGTAACLPVLVVVHQFCQGNLAFRQATKEAVFPAADEANFRRLVMAKRREENSSDNGTATSITTTTATPTPTVRPPKNMAPLDAPLGTLRYMLIRLLTWPESHVKRFVSEILWTLCGSDATEFTLRVGMGNAMPFLGAKGMVQLPPHVFS